MFIRRPSPRQSQLGIPPSISPTPAQSAAGRDSTRWYWMLDWMSELQRVASEVDPGRLITVAEGLAAHPALDDFVGADLPIEELLHDAVLTHRVHADLCHWENLRQLAVLEQLPIGWVDPELAEALDAEDFRLLLMPTLPRATSFVPTLVGRLEPDLQRVVGAVLVDIAIAVQWPEVTAAVNGLFDTDHR